MSKHKVCRYRAQIRVTRGKVVPLTLRDHCIGSAKRGNSLLALREPREVKRHTRREIAVTFWTHTTHPQYHKTSKECL